VKAHIVGGGFGGLAAAGYLIRNVGVPGPDITIYEANERMGGGFFLGGSSQTGYNLPGSVFDREFRCAFALLDAVPSAWNPPVSVKKEFFAFNEGHPFESRGHLIDREGRIVHGPRFGLSWRDGFDLARLALNIGAEAGGAPHPGVLFPAVLLNRILVVLFDDYGVAAATRRDRVAALPESHLARVPVHFGHGEYLACGTRAG
jgi:hypothetical protein